MQDFFFGDITAHKANGVKYPLRDMNDLTKRVTPDFFTDQLNRLVRIGNQRLTLTDDTSMPDFESLVSHIRPEAVGYVRIYPRKDINSAVEATLACDLIMKEGVVTVCPHWCAYKDIRAAEVVSTLLVPLHRTGLAARTYLDDGEQEHRLIMLGSTEDEIRAVFRLAGYGLLLGHDDDSRRRLNQYVQDLCAASEKH